MELPDPASSHGARGGIINVLSVRMPEEFVEMLSAHSDGRSAYATYLHTTLHGITPAATVVAGHPAPPFGTFKPPPRGLSAAPVLEYLELSLTPGEARAKLETIADRLFLLDANSHDALKLGGRLRPFVLHMLLAEMRAYYECYERGASGRRRRAARHRASARRANLSLPPNY